VAVFHSEMLVPLRLPLPPLAWHHHFMLSRHEFFYGYPTVPVVSG
jgi:hypothetical protein